MNTCLDALKTAQEIHEQTPILLSRLYYVKCKLLKSENRDLYIENPDWSKLRTKLEKKFPLCPDLNRIPHANVFDENADAIIHELQPIYDIFVDVYRLIMKVKANIKDFPSRITDFKVKKNFPLVTLWMETVISYVKILYFLENFPESITLLLFYNAAHLVVNDYEPLPLANELKSFLKELADFRRVALLEYFQTLYALLYATCIECTDIIQSMQNSENIRNNNIFNPIYDLHNLSQPTTPSIMMQRKQQSQMDQQINGLPINPTNGTLPTPHTHYLTKGLYSSSFQLKWYEEIQQLNVIYEFVLIVGLVSPWCYLQTPFVNLLRSVLEYRFILPVYRDVTVNIHIEYEQMSYVFTDFLAAMNTGDNAFSFFPSASASAVSAPTTTLPILPKSFKYSKLLKALSRHSLSVAGSKQSSRRRIMVNELATLMQMCELTPSIYASKWTLINTLVKLLRNEIIAYFHHFPEISQDIDVEAALVSEDAKHKGKYDQYYSPLPTRKDSKSRYNTMDYVHIKEISHCIACVTKCISTCRALYKTIIRPYYEEYVQQYDLQMLLFNSLGNEGVSNIKQKNWYEELHEVFTSISPMLTTIFNCFTAMKQIPMMDTLPTAASSSSTTMIMKNVYQEIYHSSMQIIMILNSFYQHRVAMKQYPVVYESLYTYLTTWLVPHTRIAYGNCNIYIDAPTNIVMSGELNHSSVSLLNGKLHVSGLDWFIKEHWQIADIVWYEDLIAHHTLLPLTYASYFSTHHYHHHLQQHQQFGDRWITPKDLSDVTSWLTVLHHCNYTFEKTTYAQDSAFFLPLLMEFTIPLIDDILAFYACWIRDYLREYLQLESNCAPISLADRLAHYQEQRQGNSTAHGRNGMFRIILESLPGSESEEDNLATIGKFTQLYNCLTEVTTAFTQFHVKVTNYQGLKLYQRMYHFPQLLYDQWFYDYFDPTVTFYQFVFHPTFYQSFLSVVYRNEEDRQSMASRGSNVTGTERHGNVGKHPAKVTIIALTQLNRFSVTYKKFISSLSASQHILSYTNLAFPSTGTTNTASTTISNSNEQLVKDNFYGRMSDVLYYLSAKDHQLDETSDTKRQEKEHIRKYGIFGYLYEPTALSDTTNKKQSKQKTKKMKKPMKKIVEHDDESGENEGKEDATACEEEDEDADDAGRITLEDIEVDDDNTIRDSNMTMNSEGTLPTSSSSRKELIDYYIEWFQLLINTIVNTSHNITPFIPSDATDTTSTGRASASARKHRGSSFQANNSSAVSMNATGPYVFVPYRNGFYNLSSLVPSGSSSNSSSTSSSNISSDGRRFVIEEYLHIDEIECLVRLIGVQGVIEIEYFLLQYFTSQMEYLCDYLQDDWAIWECLERDYMTSMESLFPLGSTSTNSLAIIHRILLTMSVILTIRELLWKAMSKVNQEILGDLYDTLSLYCRTFFPAEQKIDQKTKAIWSKVLQLAHGVGLSSSTASVITSSTATRTTPHSVSVTLQEQILVEYLLHSMPMLSLIDDEDEQPPTASATAAAPCPTSYLSLLRYLPVIGGALCTYHYYNTGTIITLPSVNGNTQTIPSSASTAMNTLLGMFTASTGNNKNDGIVIADQMISSSNMQLLPYIFSKLSYLVSACYVSLANTDPSSMTKNPSLRIIPSLPSHARNDYHLPTTIPMNLSESRIMDYSTLHIDYLEIVSGMILSMHSYVTSMMIQQQQHHTSTALTAAAGMNSLSSSSASLSTRLPIFLQQQATAHPYSTPQAAAAAAAVMGNHQRGAATSSSSSSLLLGGNTNHANNMLVITNQGTSAFPLMYLNMLYFVDYSAPFVQSSQLEAYIPYHLIHHALVDMTLGKMKVQDGVSPFYYYRDKGKSGGNADKDYLISLL